jgi:hypothetical protein
MSTPFRSYIQRRSFSHLAAICVSAVAILSCSPLAAAQAKTAEQAPMPPQILASKSAFISNAGGDCNPMGQNGFGSGPDRAYNQFYAAIAKWGRYDLASGPAAADLVLEIHFTCPLYFDEKVTQIDAQLRLLIRDAKTNTILWGFTEHLGSAIRQGNRDKNFDKALDNLVDDIRKLVVRPDAVAGAAKS